MERKEEQECQDKALPRRRNRSGAWNLENDGLDPLGELPSCPPRATSTWVSESISSQLDGLQAREYLPIPSKRAHHGAMEDECS